MPMIETSTMRSHARARRRPRWTLRAEVVKNAVAASSSGDGPVAASTMTSHARERSSSPVAGDHVDAGGARHRDDLVAPRR